MKILNLLKKKKQPKEIKLTNEEFESYLYLLERYNKLNELPINLKEYIISKNTLSIFTNLFIEEIKDNYAEPDNSYNVLKLITLTLNDYALIEVVPNTTILDIAKQETKNFVTNSLIELEHPNIVFGEEASGILKNIENSFIPLIFVAKKYELIKI